MNNIVFSTDGKGFNDSDVVHRAMHELVALDPFQEGHGSVELTPRVSAVFALELGTTVGYAPEDVSTSKVVVLS